VRYEGSFLWAITRKLTARRIIHFKGIISASMERDLENAEHARCKDRKTSEQL